VTEPFRISVEQPKAITVSQQRDLLRAAVARNPTSQLLKTRLATLQIISDQFDEAIAVLDECVESSPSFEAYELLAQASLSRETARDNRGAREAARRAFEYSRTNLERAAALALLGKAQIRLGEEMAAQATLERALEENPHSKDAYKRLAALLLRRDAPDDLLRLADQLSARSVGHSRLFASRTLALARLGRIKEAHAFENLALFARRQMLDPPVGFANLAAFNTALAEELLAHPALRFDRYGTASSRTWRIDEPATGGSELLSALYARIGRDVAEFLAGIAHIDHPWVRARPAAAVLHNWCVITEGPGFEEWHVHQHAWLSGVYYVAVPEAVVHGDGEAGCIGFGLPDELIGKDAADAYGVEIARPTAGLSMFFPSHVYHRTFPHGLREHRICLAFDLRPA
jgi:tetratricopeptide (TPR) repeat protein